MGNTNKKRKVYQVAREFQISNDTLISFLKVSFKIRNHMSPVTDEMYEEVVKKFSKEIELSDKDIDIKQKIREKRAREEAKKIEAQREYEEKLRTSYQIMAERPRARKVTLKTVITEVPPTDETEAAEEAKTIKPQKPTEDTEQSSVPEILKKEKKEKISKDAEEAVKELVSKQKQKPKKSEIVSIKKKEIKTTRKKIEIDSERELELKVIRKISEAAKDKKKEILFPDDTKKKRSHKKLKAKDRIAELSKAEEEAVGRKKSIKGRKKREQLIEGAEVPKGKYKKKSKKRKKPQISEEEVAESIKQTFELMSDKGKAKKRKKKIKTDEAIAEETNGLKVHEYISVSELATEMDIEPSEVIKKCLELGTLVSINQRLDEEIIHAVGDEFGFEVEIIPEYGTEKFEEIEDKDDDKLAEPRSPVVTIMGHVDHGKTSLLDYIRESNIIDKETGGITQHIGAYSVNVNGKSITFLDTPGHEAFTAMRARGAQVTDIVVLVVAADDNVMPQTIEAIDHAKAANVPIIVAINKIDKPNANVELIKKQLSEHGVLIESWGGKYQSVEISAKTGQGIDKLLESILVEAEMLELKANPHRLARGVVIESKLDRGKGVVATILIQKGSLKIGDPFISGQYSGKVRSLYNDRGMKTMDAGPSTPVQVVGFSGLPQAGDGIIVLESEKDTKEISIKRQQIRREQELRRMKYLTLDEISRRIKEGQVKELSMIIKGDVDGTVEAICDSLSKLSNSEVAVKIIHKSVGAISESDVLLASASNAIILGFQVRPTIKAREIATRENVDIRLYKVIYDAISDVKDALEGLLEPEIEEKNLGVVEIRQVFRVPKVGSVAGCYVISGKVTRNDNAKLFRNDKLIFDGKISSLKRHKDDVKEVVGGFECGIKLDGYEDYKVNDIIEAYKLAEIKRTLTSLQ